MAPFRTPAWPTAAGVELMTQLRRPYGLSGIALSGYGMEEDVRRSVEAGFVAHLVKPVELNEIRRALRKLHQASKENPQNS
jgi:CheY-like chemotaxis protein